MRRRGKFAMWVRDVSVSDQPAGPTAIEVVCRGDSLPWLGPVHSAAIEGHQKCSRSPLFREQRNAFGRVG